MASFCYLFIAIISSVKSPVNTAITFNVRQSPAENTWRTALEKTIKEVDFDFVINKNLMIRTILRIWTFLQIKNEIDQIVRPPKNTDSAKLLRIQVWYNFTTVRANNPTDAAGCSVGQESHE
ncbi:uncharacterized protein [Rhodnius prolixus]|uniref:uncharacterized protein n=1 Tax=Rhodnius prolixus TaxID=13249 RepID=UPI003D189D77